MKNNKNTLKRLSCAALALPGLMQDANAGRIDEHYSSDFQYGHYQESGGRMQVDVYDVAASAPIGKSITASFNAVRDVIGGASPMFNLPDAQTGKPKQILSGASIRERREAVNVNVTYFLDDVSLGIGGGVSRENDYLSRYVNTNASWEFNKKLTTLSVGVSAAFDEIEPTGQVFTRSKTSQQYLLGVSQVINDSSIIRSSMTFAYHNGYLSDPYKLVFFEGGGIRPDKRPERRFEWAWLTQYVQHFKAFNHAALHADYRLYMNDWGVNAHMLELSWHQPIVDGWQVIPKFRYYTQDKADFYRPYFEGQSQAQVYSSDYRLAGFGALSGGLKLSKDFSKFSVFEGLKIQAGVEYYNHKSSYQLGGNDSGSFDDFNYYLVTASINLKF